MIPLAIWMIALAIVVGGRLLRAKYYTSLEAQRHERWVMVNTPHMYNVIKDAELTIPGRHRLEA